MADYKINIKLDTKEVVTGAKDAEIALQGIDNAATEANQGLELLSKGFSFLKGAVTLPFQQFRALVGVSDDLSRSYDEQFRVIKQLDFAYEEFAGATEDQKRQLHDLIQALKDNSREDDVAIARGAKIAATYGHQGEELEKLLRAAKGVAAFYEIDFASAVTRVERAVQSGSLKIGRDAPIALSALTDSAGRTVEVLDKLQRFERVSDELLDSTAAKSIQLGHSFDDLQKALGSVIDQTPEVRAFFKVMTESLDELSDFITKNKGELSDIFGRVFTASLNLAKVSLVAFVEFGKKAFEGLLDLFLNVAASPIGGLLNLDEGLQDLSKFRNAQNLLASQLQRVASIEKLIADERARGLGARPDQLFRLNEQLKQFSGFADKTKKEIGELRQSVLGFDSDGIIGPILQAAHEVGDAASKAIDSGVILFNPEALADKWRRSSEEIRAAQRAAAEGAKVGPQLPDNVRPTDGFGDPHLKALETQYRALINPQAEFRAALDELHELEKARVLTIDETTTALVELWSKGLEGATTYADGVRVAFAGINKEAQDNAQVSIDIINLGMDTLTNAIVAIGTEGPEAFRRLGEAAVQELTRILVRALLVKAVTAAVGGDLFRTGNVTSSEVLFNPGVVDAGRATGGPVFPGRVYPVGEAGMEYFVPRTQGEIVPAREMGSPSVNVHVINVNNQEEAMASAIGSGRFDQLILNVAQRNPRAYAALIR